MQLGIHLGTFQHGSLEAKLDAVVRHGLESIHFNFKSLGLPSMPRQVDPATHRRIVSQMRARGISMATLSGTFNMIHPDPQQRREGLQRLEVIAAAARPLGTEVVTLCTGTRDAEDMWRSHPDNNTPGAWRDLLESMHTALDTARKHDVTLAIEPEVSNVVDSAARARELLDKMDSPRLKVIIDGANLFERDTLSQMHPVLDAAFDLLGPDVVLGHAKELDADGRAGGLAAGRGGLDWAHYLGLFRKIGFDGPLILHSLAETEVARSAAFLRQQLAALDET